MSRKLYVGINPGEASNRDVLSFHPSWANDGVNFNEVLATFASNAFVEIVVDRVLEFVPRSGHVAILLNLAEKLADGGKLTVSAQSLYGLVFK